MSKQNGDFARQHHSDGNGFTVAHFVAAQVLNSVAKSVSVLHAHLGVVFVAGRVEAERLFAGRHLDALVQETRVLKVANVVLEEKLQKLSVCRNEKEKMIGEQRA